MPRFDRVPRSFLRLIRYPPRVLYALGLGPLIGRLVLLLTTTGRKTGLARVTPLQYEEIDGIIYVGAALGEKSDWVRNIRANPTVQVRVKDQTFQAHAEIISDPCQIADFLEVRLERHPHMIGAMMRAEGVGRNPSRAQLEDFARQGVTLVRLRKVAVETFNDMSGEIPKNSSAIDPR